MVIAAIKKKKKKPLVTVATASGAKPCQVHPDSLADAADAPFGLGRGYSARAAPAILLRVFWPMERRASRGQRMHTSCLPKS
jgi:hypothetical protein